MARLSYHKQGGGWIMVGCDYGVAFFNALHGLLLLSLPTLVLHTGLVLGFSMFQGYKRVPDEVADEIPGGSWAP